MRARNIKPGFYTDAHLEECTIQARWIFPALWMFADREGRLVDDPKQMKREICPYDKFDVNKLLNELKNVGAITRYTVGGHGYIQVNNFLKHQNPHKNEPPSVIPPPPEKDLEYSSNDPSAPVAEKNGESKESGRKKFTAKQRDRVWFEALKKTYPAHRREDQPEWAWKAFRNHLKNKNGKDRKAAFLELWLATKTARASPEFARDEGKWVPGFGKWLKGKWKAFSNEQASRVHDEYADLYS